MESDLICNFKKCRKPLSSFAWVTSCSHIFCDEDGTREFNKSYACPACDHDLCGKFDIIRTDLSPTDQYKSMVLAGQKPDVVMEICTRALSFWTYQAHQERTYHEYLSTKSKERCQKLEQYYEQALARLQTEISSLKTQITSAKQDLEATKSRYNECASKLAERNRHYQKLQSMYDIMRRRTVTASTFGPADDPPTQLKPMLAPRFGQLQSHGKTLTGGSNAVRGISSGDSHVAPNNNMEGREADFQLRPQAASGQQPIQFEGFRLPTPPAGMLKTPQLGLNGPSADSDMSAAASADMQAKFTLNLAMPGQQFTNVVEPKRFQ